MSSLMRPLLQAHSFSWDPHLLCATVLLDSVSVWEVLFGSWCWLVCLDCDPCSRSPLHRDIPHPSTLLGHIESDSHAKSLPSMDVPLTVSETAHHAGCSSTATFCLLMDTVSLCEVIIHKDTIFTLLRLLQLVSGYCSYLPIAPLATVVTDVSCLTRYAYCVD